MNSELKLDGLSSLKDADAISSALDLTSTYLCAYGYKDKNTGLFVYSDAYSPFEIENARTYSSLSNIKSTNGFSSYYLNGNKVEMPINSLSTPGDYSFVASGDILEKIINFSIAEKSSNLIEGHSYSLNVTPYFTCKNNATYELDGEPYKYGTKITEIGNHEITVFGIGGYKKNYSFTVEPVVDGLSDQDFAYGWKTFFISGNDGLDITLDGAHQKSNLNITVVEPGKHLLKIEGTNGYVKQISFEIRPSVDGLSMASPNIFTRYATFHSSYQAYIDGEPYIDGSVYNVVGNHEFVIFGTNKSRWPYEFTIAPLVRGIENDGTYNSSVEFEVFGGEPYLDGEDISWSKYGKEDGVKYLVTDPALHKLEIKGTNGYSLEISFRVQLSENFFIDDDGIANYSFSGGKTYLDGNVIKNEGRISSIGVHALEVYGFDGSRQYSKSFIIRGKMDSIPNGISYDPPVIPELNAKVYLDGQLINTKTKTVVTKNGNHTLKVIGHNYIDEFTFTYANPAYLIAPACFLLAIAGSVFALLLLMARKKGTKK